MKPDLEELKLTERELERLSGLDIGDIFVGGVLGGVYRPSVLRSPAQLLSLCFAELFVGLLTFIFTLPIGLLWLRNHQQSVNQLPLIAQFLQVTLGTTALLMIAWNLYLAWGSRRLATLMRLLDDIDRYHSVLQGVELLDKLEAIDSLPVNLAQRQQVLEALRVTRSSLVSALVTEKILRENRGLIARRQDLLTQIETNLATLQTLEGSQQATEYGQALNEALAIGLSVHQEMRRLSDDTAHSSS